MTTVCENIIFNVYEMMISILIISINGYMVKFTFSSIRSIFNALAVLPKHALQIASPAKNERYIQI